METGKRNDTAAFEPLIEEFDERYDTDKLQAVLSDAGFDSQDNREFCQDWLDCPLLTAINPRRSSPLATIKEEIKELFEDHGEEIDSPYDALERLPQKQLSEYGVEVGNVEETYIFQAIKERMHRHLRAGVDRHRTTVYRWVQKADLQPTDGANPNHVATGETVIQLNNDRY